MEGKGGRYGPEEKDSSRSSVAAQLVDVTPLTGTTRKNIHLMTYI